MIDSTLLNAYPGRPAEPGNPSQPTRFYMKRDPDARMAGSMPVWEGHNKTGAPEVRPHNNFESALHYAGAETAAGERVDDEADSTNSFGFGDLLDIVNPLHHIPLVSHLYEGLTGDEIKPSGRIIGGALFGGFAGAAAGIANVIVEEETGKDVTGNVVAMITEGRMPVQRKETLSPEEHLNQAARMAFSNVEAEPLPPLAFSLQSSPSVLHNQSTTFRQKIVISDEARMAGTTPRDRAQHAPQNHPALAFPLPSAPLADPASINLALIRAEQSQTPLTELKLSAMPQD